MCFRNCWYAAIFESHANNPKLKSDHFLVFAALNLRMPKPPAVYVVARSYKYYDPQSFLSDLNKIPWYENILSGDVNEKLLHFNKAFFRVLDNHAPIKKIKIKHRRCPFVNEEIKEKMAKRDQAHKIARELDGCSCGLAVLS